MKTAYAMLAFNHRTKEILGWMVTSDDNLTVMGSATRYAKLTEATGPDYESAKRAAEDLVRQWFPGLGEPSR